MKIGFYRNFETSWDLDESKIGVLQTRDHQFAYSDAGTEFKVFGWSDGFNKVYWGEVMDVDIWLGSQSEVIAANNTAQKSSPFEKLWEPKDVQTMLMAQSSPSLATETNDGFSTGASFGIGAALGGALGLYVAAKSNHATAPAKTQEYFL